MKSYTDIEQSKKLKEILPIESADMFYVYDRHLDKLYGDTPYPIGYKVLNENVDIPCWSLAALLEIISYPTLSQGYDSRWSCMNFPGNEEVEGCENPIDACYELILNLRK